MGELEDFVVCTINHGLTKMTLNIYQLDLINNMTQVFNKDVKSLKTFNNPDIPYKGILNRHKNIIQCTEEIQEWHSITTIPCEALAIRTI